MTAREQNDSGQPRDALSQRYLDASAQDTRRPAERVRTSVLAHAQMQLAQGNQAATHQAHTPPTARGTAANQSRWKLSLLASIALAGLTSLLVLQFERGTPDEKELALGQKAASESAASPPSYPPSNLPSNSPSNSPLPLPSSSPSYSPSFSPTTPSPPAVPTPPALPEATPSMRPPPAAQPAQPTAPKESRQVKPSPAPGPPTPEAQTSAAPMPSITPAPSPSPFPASRQSASPPSLSKAESPTLADTPPAAPPAAPSRTPDQAMETARRDELETGRLRDAAPRAAAPPPAPAPVAAAPPAAARAQAPNQNRSAGAAPSLLSQLEAAPDAKRAFQQAARSGNTAQLERLLAQGVPLQSVLNAPDDSGKTPLILAVINGHGAMVQRLLALGANPALVDQSGINALQHARQQGRKDIAALIEAAQ